MPCVRLGCAAATSLFEANSKSPGPGRDERGACGSRPGIPRCPRVFPVPQNWTTSAHAEESLVVKRTHLSERLEGFDLDGGWTIDDKIVPAEGMTGSNFSIGYSAQRSDGVPGFVKVLDISRAALAPDPARTLEAITVAFNFERDLVKQCSHMSRVVSALSEGTVRDDSQVGPGEVAQYIVFEMAESDLRAKVQLSRDFDLAMEMRALHNVATGLAQLHASFIAHQDLKPSNVLVFDNGLSKVGDLGRSFSVDHSGPHDELAKPGDPAYCPPEQLYGYSPEDWKDRRFSSDLYQLGSLVVFVFTGMSVTRLLHDHIPEIHRHGTWTDTYESVLPYLHEYFRIMVERVSTRMPEIIRPELVLAVTQLCRPDPARRGHPRNHAIKNPYGLERYVSLFDRLAVKAEIELRGRRVRP